tara:strand:- start:66 stop:1199 length:1134 start_codon:yes stop_codon:yes gene_type:complete
VKNKTLLLARPDHSVNIWEYNSNNQDFYYATFNVTIENSFLSKVVSKGKCLKSNGRVKNLFFIGLYNQMCRLFRKYGVDLFKFEGVVISKLAESYICLGDYKVVHYWPVYFSKLIENNKVPGCKYIAEVYEGNYTFAQSLYKEAYAKNGMTYNLVPNKSTRYEDLDLADIIFVPSDFVKKTYEGVVKPEIKVVDFGLLGRSTSDKKSTFNGEVLNLLFIGHASIEKGFDLLVKSSERKSNFIISSIGSVSKEIEVLDIYGKISYLGKKSHNEVIECIEQFDAVILPSYCDAFSMAIIESLCCTKPVIVSSNCGNSTVVDKWKMGSVFETGSVDSMIMSINDVIDNYDLYRNNIKDYQKHEVMNPYPKRISEIYKSLI